MPFVPVTGSRMNAAIVSGPSSSIVSSSRASAVCGVVDLALRAVVRIEHVHDAGHRRLLVAASDAGRR